MAADEMPGFPEMPNFWAGEKRSPADQPGGDEEVAAPSSPAQLLPHTKSALTAIIEGEE
jgi:hypothetical protein